MTNKQTPSAGAVRAARELLRKRPDYDFPFSETIEEVIDYETHATEMEAFIEKIAARKHTFLCDVVDEAQELIEKARG